MRKHKDYRFERISAVFSIYLMVSLTFVSAQAFAVQSSEELNNKEGLRDIRDALISFLNFLLPGVAAQEFCCVKSTGGSYCQDTSDPNFVCDVPLTPGKCSDLGIPECNTGTCVQQNGDCDANYKRQKCEDNFGQFINRPLLEIPACTPTCAVFTDGGQVIDSEFVFFRNKIGKLPQVKDQKLSWEERDISFNACQQVVPPKTLGYCTIEDRATCEYTSKENCDARQGEFSSQRCASCQPNLPENRKCFNGDQGYGVYNFDSCGGPGDILDTGRCGVNQLCEINEDTDEAQCVDKQCSIDVKFTNLGYDTAYLKARQVEVEGPFGLQTATVGSSFDLNQGEQACVRFQGPGEQHYAVTCQLGELLAFGMDDQREKICGYSSGETFTQDNAYETCSNAGQDKSFFGNVGFFSKAFDFLGADLITPRWWDYWVINPGLSDSSSCSAQGMCVSTENNDCVPKYPPATVDRCQECQTTQASSPWSKCGEAVQCESRGYCQQVKNPVNPLAATTICAIETVSQAVLLAGLRKGAEKYLNVPQRLQDAIDEEVKEIADELGKEKDPKTAKSGFLGRATKGWDENHKTWKESWQGKEGEATATKAVLAPVRYLSGILGGAISFFGGGVVDTLSGVASFLPGNEEQKFSAKTGSEQLAARYKAEVNRPFSWLGTLNFLYTFFTGQAPKDINQRLNDLNKREADLLRELNAQPKTAQTDAPKGTSGGATVSVPGVGDFTVTPDGKVIGQDGKPASDDVANKIKELKRIRETKVTYTGRQDQPAAGTVTPPVKTTKPRAATTETGTSGPTAAGAELGPGEEPAPTGGKMPPIDLPERRTGTGLMDVDQSGPTAAGATFGPGEETRRASSAEAEAELLRKRTELREQRTLLIEEQKKAAQTERPAVTPQQLGEQLVNLEKDIGIIEAQIKEVQSIPLLKPGETKVPLQRELLQDTESTRNWYCLWLCKSNARTLENTYNDGKKEVFEAKFSGDKITKVEVTSPYAPKGRETITWDLNTPEIRSFDFETKLPSHQDVTQAFSLIDKYQLLSSGATLDPQAYNYNEAYNLLQQAVKNQQAQKAIPGQSFISNTDAVIITSQLSKPIDQSIVTNGLAVRQGLERYKSSGDYNYREYFDKWGVANSIGETRDAKYRNYQAELVKNPPRINGLINPYYLDRLNDFQNPLQKSTKKTTQPAPPLFLGGAITGLQVSAPRPTQQPAARPNILQRIDSINTLNTQSSQYYGGLYYFPIREAGEAQSQNYWGAIDSWWRAQGGFLGFLQHQFTSLAKGALISYLLVKLPFGGSFSKLSAQYWIKQGVCASLVGVYPGGLQACQESNVILPILACTLQANVRGQVLESNACIPVGAQGMRGVESGFNNCEICHTDSFPCTPQRCQALSADSSCVYDPFKRQCLPDPEKVKSCDATGSTALIVETINSQRITTAATGFERRNIPYEDLTFEIEVKTNIASECRLTVNKTEGWENMAEIPEDGTFKFHNISLDISQPERSNFTYFVLCQNVCRKQSFSEITEIRLQKAAKPDLIGPVILNRFPQPDTPVEGGTGTNKKKEITINVETDEDAECKYKRWELAEGIDSFVGEIAKIEKIASSLLGAGASESTLESAISLTGLNWDDANLTRIGQEGNFSKKHEKQFRGANALDNDKIYAYVFLCRDRQQNLGEIPGVVRFKVSEHFKVDITQPGATTVEGKPQVKASTDRPAVCRYSIENKLPYDQMSTFRDTGRLSHRTTVDRLLSFGRHKVFVSCLDEDGFNIASDEQEFDVVKDSTGPRIIRAYRDSDTLLIGTDELTSCQYSFKRFTFGQGSEMTGNNPVSTTHRAEWRPETTYYISCRDRFGNALNTAIKTTKGAGEEILF